MKKVGLLILTLLLTTNTLWSLGNGILPSDWRQRELSTFGLTGANGSPEVFESFLPAVIYMSNGQILTGISVNIYNEDDLVVAKPYKGYESHYDIEENNIERFEVITGSHQNRVFKRLYKDSFETSYTPQGFYEILSDDKTFIKRSYKDFLKAEKSDGYSQVRTVDEFVPVTKYYLKGNEQEKYKEVKLSKKSISKVLGNRAGAAKSIMKKNKWKWNNEAHILLLLSQL